MNPEADGCDKGLRNFFWLYLSCKEAYLAFLNRFLDFFNFDFAEALDLQQRPSRGAVDRLKNRPFSLAAVRQRRFLLRKALLPRWYKIHWPSVL